MQHIAGEPRALAGASWRWRLGALLFAASALNYVDRQSLAVLKPLLEAHFGWSEAAYAWMTFCFQVAYGGTMALAGALLDRIGVRRGLALAVVAWSLAAAAHALASTPAAFSAARFALGVAEAFLFPAAAKSIALAFPASERGLAFGIVNAGTSAGVVSAPFIYWLAETQGWQLAFALSGGLGLLWVLPWWRSIPEAPPLPAPDSAAAGRELTLASLLTRRQAWVIFVGRFFADPVWGFYLFWLPSYLAKERHLPGVGAAALLVPAYLAANVGGIVGGAISGRLVARGMPSARARLAVMAGVAAAMPLTIGAAFVESTAAAILLVSVATASHQAWSTNVLALASDLFPERAVGRITGLGGLWGSAGAMFMALGVGAALEVGIGYGRLFLLAGLMHPIAFALVLLLGGRTLLPIGALGPPEARSRRLLSRVGAALAIVSAALGAMILVERQRIASLTHPTTVAGALVAALCVAALGVTCVVSARRRAGDER